MHTTHQNSLMTQDNTLPAKMIKKTLPNDYI